MTSTKYLHSTMIANTIIVIMEWIGITQAKTASIADSSILHNMLLRLLDQERRSLCLRITTSGLKFQLELKRWS